MLLRTSWRALLVCALPFTLSVCKKRAENSQVQNGEVKGSRDSSQWVYQPQANCLIDAYLPPHMVEPRSMKCEERRKIIKSERFVKIKSGENKKIPIHEVWSQQVGYLFSTEDRKRYVRTNSTDTSGSPIFFADRDWSDSKRFQVRCVLNVRYIGTDDKANVRDTEIDLLINPSETDVLAESTEFDMLTDLKKPLSQDAVFTECAKLRQSEEEVLDELDQILKENLML